MGCDIHIQIERRVNGKWERVPWRDTYRFAGAPFWESGQLLMPEGFDGRNYNLFGVLADVRNGTWGEPVTPISQPRGFPADMVDPLPEDGDDAYRLGDHSYSWLSLAEIDAYDWTAPLKMRGWVSHEVAEKFRADGIPPTSYAGGGNHGEYIDWTSTVEEHVHDWPKECLPFLRMLGAPNDVRLVFGFDS